jgi:pimeloyl-ACP methyl ester carboxylesterase
LLEGWEGPVEVLVAADDRIVELDRLRRFCASRPQTELSVIESAGHGWDAELIRRQLDVLESFLAGSEPSVQSPQTAV